MIPENIFKWYIACSYYCFWVQLGYMSKDMVCSFLNQMDHDIFNANKQYKYNNQGILQTTMLKDVTRNS